MPGLTGAAAKAPPLSLPARHFAAALGFLLLGSVGLLWAAPELAAGLFPLPRVVAVTHLFTLGWITTSILGALYQFLPVALGESIRSERIARLTFWLYAPGVAVFVAGLLTGHTAVVAVGAAAFASALLLFAGNLAATLRRAAERGVTWWALAGADLFLLVTVLLGSALAGNLRWGYLGPNRFLALGVHLHVAIFGWVGLVVVGVANRLLPMFLLSHGAGERLARAAVALLTAGVATLVLLHHAGPALRVWPAAVLIGGGAVAFLLQARAFYRQRRKPVLDAGMTLAAVGLGYLALGLVLAPAALYYGTAAPRLVMAYVATLVLAGFTLFVAGHYYKIVPFLVWYHRFGPLAGKRPLPTVAQLYSPGPARAVVWLLALGAGGVVAGVALGTTPVVQAGSALFAAGATVEAVQMLALSRRRPE